MRLRRAVVLAVAVAAAIGPVDVAAASADQSSLPGSDSTASPPGKVTLFDDPGMRHGVFATDYVTCARPASDQVSVTVLTFENRPAAGCQVVLQRETTSHVLCAGRGQVPVAVRAAPKVIVRSGPSPTCTVQMGFAAGTSVNDGGEVGTTSGPFIGYTRPGGGWGAASVSNVNVRGHNGYYQRYTWRVITPVVQVCAQIYSPVFGGPGWYDAGCGLGGDHEYLWGPTTAKPKMRFRSPFGDARYIQVYWWH